MFLKFFSLLNNREIATLVWIFIQAVFSKKGTAKLFFKVLKCFFQWKVLVMEIFAFIYTLLIILLLYKVFFWDYSMLKDSIIWYVLSAMSILLRLNNADGNYFKNIVLDTIRYTVLFEFVVNIHNFSLVAELIIVPVYLFISAAIDYSATEEKYKIANKLMTIILVLMGCVICSFSINDIIYDFDKFASYDTIKSFLLPIILTLCFVPCAYLIALFAKYEMLFIRIERTVAKDLIWYTKMQSLLYGNLSFNNIDNLSTKINYLHTELPKEEIKKLLS